MHGFNRIPIKTLLARIAATHSARTITSSAVNTRHEDLADLHHAAQPRLQIQDRWINRNILEHSPPPRTSTSKQ